MNVRAACVGLVVVVALLSAPTPLPGHLLVWRRLRADGRRGVDGLAASGVERGTLSI
jgi:hypothetical protein